MTEGALPERTAQALANSDEAQLDWLVNARRDMDYVTRFGCPDFTSMCPVTCQPDFAHLVIDYVPGEWLVESKLSKLYLAFRNHGAFHEGCTLAIGKRLAGQMKPRWLRIGGYWYTHGGMPIDVFCQTGDAPTGICLPDKRCPLPRARIADIRRIFLFNEKFIFVL